MISSEVFTLNNVILVALLLIQLLKLFRPFLTKFEWGRKLLAEYDAGKQWVEVHAPLVFDIIEVAQMKGQLKDSKPVEFLIRLRDEAQRQGVSLTPQNEAKAVFIAAACNAQKKLSVPGTILNLPALKNQ